ncbi:MAG: hypothetical protein AB7O68_10400 [Pirellulales bacterium]
MDIPAQQPAHGTATSNRFAVLVILVLMFEIAFWGWALSIDIAGPAADWAWTVAFAHTTLAAAWFAAANARLFARVLVLAAADLLYATAEGGRNYAVMLLATSLVHQVALVSIYFASTRIGVAPRLSSAPIGRRRSQLSLIEVLALATLLAIVMAAGRWFDFRLPVQTRAWVVQAVLAALALGILGILLPPRRRLGWIVATSVLLISPAVVYLQWDPRQGDDLARYAAIVGLAGLAWLGLRQLSTRTMRECPPERGSEVVG